MLKALLGEFARRAKAEGQEAAMQRAVRRAGAHERLYRRLETCGKPVVAAINGTCLGGAFELALACHGRIVADDDEDASSACPR